MIPKLVVPATVLALVLFITGLSGAADYVPPAVDRTKIDISGNAWKFDSSNNLTGAQSASYGDGSWTTVTLPHTWNTKANRATYTYSWYRTHFTSSSSDSAGGKRFYLFFGAATENADVYQNGTFLGHHSGGYTAFIFDGTAARVDGDNVIAVKVDNYNHPGLPSSPDGWEHFGGLTRKAFILKTNRYAIDPTDYGSSGVYIKQSAVSAAGATVTVKTMLRNTDVADKTFTVKNIFCDSTGVIVTTLQGSRTVRANMHDSITIGGSISNPVLWTIGVPYLYRVYTELWVDSAARDLVAERTGFRYYRLDNTSFTINGTQTPLRGGCLHAEFEYTWNAIDSATVSRQFDVVQDLGMNYIRLVHYCHPAFAYNLADERGLAVSTEDGLWGGSSNVINATRDSTCRELVKQNYNHPSVLWWGAGNEDGYSNAANSTHFAAVLRPCDSSRPIVYASSGQSPTGMDYIFQNIYPGWYGGTIQSFPSGNHWISESGAGAVVTSHQDYHSTTFTVNTWEPEEYAELNLEYKFQYLFNTSPSSVPLYSHWLLFDICDVKYKGMNTKGLLTAAGLPKDPYYLWRAKARPSTPLVWIAGKRWYLRTAGRDVKVYSNRPSIALSVNGVAKGAKADGLYKTPAGGSVINNVYFFDTVLYKGKNVVIASDGAGAADTAVIYFAGTAPAAPTDSLAAITNLISGNASDTAYFINAPVHGQWPIYYQCDGKADNSFDTIPSVLTGAGWIATKRQSATGATASLSFTINPVLKTNADVFVMFTQQSSAPSWITSAGFANTGVTGNWRDNSMNPVSCQLYRKTVSPGSMVLLSGSAIDFVVLVKAGTESGIVRKEVESVARHWTSVFKTIGRKITLPAECGPGRKTVDLYNLAGEKIRSMEIQGRSFDTGMPGQVLILQVKTEAKTPTVSHR